MSNNRNEQIGSWVDSVKDENTKTYMTTRVLPQMESYSKKSAECKKKYHFWATITIIIGIFIPVFSLFADGSIYIKVALTLSGSLMSGINAYLNLYNYQTLWSNYRYCREELLSILLQYFTVTGAFVSLNEEERNKALVDACETVINSEKSDWRQMIKSGAD